MAPGKSGLHARGEGERVMALESNSVEIAPEKRSPRTTFPPGGKRSSQDTSTGDTQTQFFLCLCGVSGSWCTQGLFESSECSWWAVAHQALLSMGFSIVNTT